MPGNPIHTCHTVGELIAVLSKYDHNKRICIEDADTYWVGEEVHVSETDRHVYMFIKYIEMDSEIEL